MYRAATAAFDRADGAVMCAAVADYTPETCADRKLKKGDGELTIRLRRTKDIAAELGSRKGGRVLVGFALETDDEEAHAREKLRRKHFDFVVLNSLRDAGAGFPRRHQQGDLRLGVGQRTAAAARQTRGGRPHRR